MGTGSFLGVKQGAWRLPPTPSSAEVKERIELYLYSPWNFVICSGEKLFIPWFNSLTQYVFVLNALFKKAAN
jgi:hypothetical protein